MRVERAKGSTGNEVNESVLVRDIGSMVSRTIYENTARAFRDRDTCMERIICAILAYWITTQHKSSDKIYLNSLIEAP